MPQRMQETKEIDRGESIIRRTKQHTKVKTQEIYEKSLAYSTIMNEI